MRLPGTAAVAALAAGSLAMGFGTAHAEPAPPPQQQINYGVQLIGETVVTTLQGGTFDITERSETPEGAPIADDAAKGTEMVEVKDNQGNVVVSWPVDVTVGDIAVPVTPVLKNDDTVLELTPHPQEQLPAQEQTTVNVITQDEAVAKDIASPAENNSAMQEFATQFGIATSVGGFVGTAIGVVVGGITGCILGLPLLAVGCIPAAVAGAGVGGILGTIAVGGPALGIAGMELLNTLQAPPGTTKWVNGGMPE